MKSAYELAMERLEKSAPTQKVTDEQRAEIAELDSVYQAKIAERELFLQGEMQKGAATGNWGEVKALQDQLNRDIPALRNELEEKKEKLRAKFATAPGGSAS